MNPLSPDRFHRSGRGRPGRRRAALGISTTVMVIAAVALTAAGVPAHAASPSAHTSRSPAGAKAMPASRLRAACGPARPGQARCLTLYKPQMAVNRAIAAGRSGLAAQPMGWGAMAIESAYKLPVSLDPHQTIAVVDAQSTPHLAADLAFYRKHYGLPPCTVTRGCLRIVNQDGHTAPLPAPDPLGWGVEETLDVAMVSAACPLCKIVLLEASSPSFADLAAAENTAAQLGVQVISNSYGGPETGFDQPYASAYHHPGHAIVASSGDSGFGAALFPANLATVTAVGGTQMVRASNPRGWKERVWDTDGAGGSGCSAYVAKPSWQHDPHCPGRTTADVAALAWNIALFDTSLRAVGGPWVTIGGTSAAAPIIAGVYGLAGNAANTTPRYPYLHRTHLFDITTGNNSLFSPPAKACGRDYMCVAKPGYDAPTGWGTPNRTAGF
jgi:subtilase family serine protease